MSYKVQICCKRSVSDLVLSILYVICDYTMTFIAYILRLDSNLTTALYKSFTYLLVGRY